MKYFLTIDNIFISDEGDVPKMNQEYNSLLAKGDFTLWYFFLQMHIILITIKPWYAFRWSCRRMYL